MGPNHVVNSYTEHYSLFPLPYLHCFVLGGTTVVLNHNTAATKRRWNWRTLLLQRPPHRLSLLSGSGCDHGEECATVHARGTCTAGRLHRAASSFRPLGNFLSLPRYHMSTVQDILRHATLTLPTSQLPCLTFPQTPTHLVSLLLTQEAL